MSKVILTIDCDFVYDKLLDIVNDMVMTENVSMADFVKTIEDSPYYSMYRNYITPNKERSEFINNIIDKHLDRMKKVIVIKEHHEILEHIESEDIVINIDYHEDIDEDESEIFCGNWANNLKNYHWTSDIDDDILDIEYDMILISYSPEWTPSVKFINNPTVRKKLEDLIKI